MGFNRLLMCHKASGICVSDAIVIPGLVLINTNRLTVTGSDKSLITAANHHFQLQISLGRKIDGRKQLQS